MNSQIIEIRNKAKQVFAALESMPEEAATKIAKTIEDKSSEGVGTNIKETLVLMRADFGDELFDKIAAGGSLVEVCDRWKAEVISRKIQELKNEVCEEFRKNGFDKITTDHVGAFIEVSIGML